MMAGFGGSVSHSAIQAGTNVIHGNLLYASCATQPQMAHMLSLLIFSLMAIWALKWPPDSSQDSETTSQIVALKETQFSAAYVENRTG